MPKREAQVAEKSTKKKKVAKDTENAGDTPVPSNEYEKAAGKKPTVEKKSPVAKTSPLRKKCSTILKDAGVSDFVEEMDERIVEVANYRNEKVKVKTVFTSFQEREDSPIGKQSVMEAVYHYMTSADKSYAIYTFEVMEENGLSILCFYEAKDAA